MSEFHGAKLAVLANRFEGIARNMANTLLRTGRSGVLNRAKDFSCCIVTASGDLLSTAESLPIHVLSGPDLMARSMTAFHPHLRRGDAFIHNSPYHGCSHPADQTILVPVIDTAGRHRFTVIAKAHQADIGNSQPTTYMADAVDVYNEGALIFPCVTVQRDYQNVADVIRMCEMRIRVPEQWRGDYLAALGAARIGERELMSLGAEFGWDPLDAFTQAWFEYSESRMAQAIAALPAGTTTVVSTHDPFPGTPAEGVPIRSTVTVDPAAGRIEVDLRDNPDCLPCGLNLSEACARTAALVGVFNSIDHTVPKNAGAFRRVNVRLRENCVVGIPRHPTSCSAATTNIADRVANGVQRALAELGDGVGMAEAGAVIPPAVGVVSGYDPRSDLRYVNQVFLGMTGGAAGPHADAWLTIGHVGNAGMSCVDAVELDELYHPIVVESRELIADSEGAGMYVGAPSIRVEFGPTLSDFEVGYVSDGHSNPPLGVRGGLPGGSAEQAIRRRDGREEQLSPCAQVRVVPGETIISISTGGGGYGPPERRSAETVALDVREGRISRGRAMDVYRVALDPDGEVDWSSTERLRAGVRQ
ncbi:MAG TPA: hydantoinase B/oxoprolinase family protein [Steroidobacteraceae bacterium]|nr:hydantoinase B/oxoprolinase family protein [Steroidobacteraceae bacterium]